MLYEDISTEHLERSREWEVSKVTLTQLLTKLDLKDSSTLRIAYFLLLLSNHQPPKSYLNYISQSHQHLIPRTWLPIESNQVSNFMSDFIFPVVKEDSMNVSGFNAHVYRQFWDLSSSLTLQLMEILSQPNRYLQTTALISREYLSLTDSFKARAADLSSFSVKTNWEIACMVETMTKFKQIIDDEDTIMQKLYKNKNLIVGNLLNSLNIFYWEKVANWLSTGSECDFIKRHTNGFRLLFELLPKFIDCKKIVECFEICNIWFQMSIQQPSISTDSLENVNFNREFAQIQRDILTWLRLNKAEISVDVINKDVTTLNIPEQKLKFNRLPKISINIINPALLKSQNDEKKAHLQKEMETANVGLDGKIQIEIKIMEKEFESQIQELIKQEAKVEWQMQRLRRHEKRQSLLESRVDKEEFLGIKEAFTPAELQSIRGNEKDFKTEGSPRIVELNQERQKDELSTVEAVEQATVEEKPIDNREIFEMTKPNCSLAKPKVARNTWLAETRKTLGVKEAALLHCDFLEVSTACALFHDQLIETFDIINDYLLLGNEFFPKDLFSNEPTNILRLLKLVCNDAEITGRDQKAISRAIQKYDSVSFKYSPERGLYLCTNVNENICIVLSDNLIYHLESLSQALLSLQIIIHFLTRQIFTLLKQKQINDVLFRFRVSLFHYNQLYFEFRALLLNPKLVGLKKYLLDYQAAVFHWLSTGRSPDKKKFNIRQLIHKFKVLETDLNIPVNTKRFIYLGQKMMEDSVDRMKLDETMTILFKTFNFIEQI